MRRLNIQIQPERSPSLDMVAAKAAIEALAEDRAVVAGIEFVEGDDGGPYVNFTFTAKQPRQLWAHIQQNILEAPVIGSAIASSSIVVCEGPNGWDDYLLLHHFDPSLETDDPDEL